MSWLFSDAPEAIEVKNQKIHLGEQAYVQTRQTSSCGVVRDCGDGPVAGTATLGHSTHRPHSLTRGHFRRLFERRHGTFSQGRKEPSDAARKTPRGEIQPVGLESRNS